MKEQSDTLWLFDPHTEAKHGILRGYLAAWMPILSHQAARLRGVDAIKYIDGFAGPGESADGKPGSPQIALAVALDHSHDLPIPVKMLFIENRADRFKHLKALIKEQQDGVDASRQIHSVVVEHRDCEELISEILEAYEVKGQTFGPALIFLDQFGYSAVSMNMIGRILRHPACEVFSFFNWRDLNRFISDETKWPGISRAFGGEEWKQVLDVTEAERADALHELYRSALRTRAGAEYFCSFAMHDDSGRLLYWLFFSSGNIRGLEEMKRAMWRIDETGHFRFSDRHAGQLRLLEGFDEVWLARSLAGRFARDAPSVREVRDYVMVETPCYQYIQALKNLEREGRVEVVGAPPRRRKGAFKKYLDDEAVRVRFSSLK